MNISILCIHMYNIIDEIVVIKFSFFVKEAYKFQSFLEALWSMVLCTVGGVEEADRESQGNEIYSCVSMCYYSAPDHFANVYQNSHQLLRCTI